MRTKCPYCSLQRDPTNAGRTLRRLGSYFRSSDGQRSDQALVLSLQKSFSAASFSPLKGQKKRQFNQKVCALLNGGVSQREAARILKINPKTVVRKFRFVSSKAKAELFRRNQKFLPSQEVEFDDLETFEHTKLKPVSVTLMVEHKSRRILGFEVAKMPANGHLARMSRKKYGPRPDERSRARRKLFSEMQSLVLRNALIRSDSNPHYSGDVKRFFPHAHHETVLGGRSAVTGQGELKKLKWDPIFSLNHTCAMLRAHINRLFRKTWCTTKKIDQLEGHIALYALEHNRRLATG
jgi:hypothetical protein